MRAAVALFFAVVCAWASAAPAAETIKTLTVGKASVGLEWSRHWQLDADSPGLTADGVAFRTADAQSMRAYLTWIPTRAEVGTDEGILSYMKHVAGSLASQVVEQEIDIQSMAGEHVRGYYVCVTDKAPKPGEYQYMCQGMIRVDGTLFIFNVLYNQPGTAEARNVVAAFNTLQLAKGT